MDTAWNDAQTRQLLAMVEEDLGRRVVAAVSTHAHADKMGGTGVLRGCGIPTFAHPVSNRLAPERELVAAQFDLPLQPDGEASADLLAPLEIFFPGAGHTVANLVVHVPGAGVLFGGCLNSPQALRVPSATPPTGTPCLGASVQAAAERFPDADKVVPSHGRPAGRELLAHTMAVANAATSGGD